MLVLGRKVGEAVDIEGVGRIVICAARDGNVRLGFDIDKRFNIVREELRSFKPVPAIAAEPLEPATVG